MALFVSALCTLGAAPTSGVPPPPVEIFLVPHTH
jgi:hypothetical protein